MRDGTISDAVDAFVTILTEAQNHYVPSSMPTMARPTVWWNRFCQKTYQRKLVAWTKRDWPAYHIAVSAAKRAQAIAFRHHHNSLLTKLQTGSNDRVRWNLTKCLSGLNKACNRSAPDVNSLATYFTIKLSLPTSFDDVSPLLPPEASAVT